MPISNARTERMIKRTTDYLNYGGQGEEDFQAVLQVVGSAIERVPSRKTKKGLVEAYKAKDLFGFFCMYWSRVTVFLRSLACIY